MTGDCMAKLLHGKKYVSFRHMINLHHDPHIASVIQQECTGSNESKLGGSDESTIEDGRW
jgi:hypothetical protein